MSPTLLLIVGALGLVGCLILLFVGLQMLREERNKKAAGEAPAPAGDAPETGGEAAPPSETPPAPAARPSLSSFTDRLGMGARAKGSAHEVLRVLRDNLTGRLLIEIAGKRYGSAADVDDPATYQGLLAILRDLADFGGAPSSEGAAAPLPAFAPPARKSAPAPAPARPAAAPAGPPKPLPPPSMNPFKQMAVLREINKIPEAPIVTIAEQIDEVLQARILGTPLVHRGIRMHPGPRGEAMFDLEGESYPSVDEVPDEEVRAVIRAAIAEWERR